MRTFCTVLMLTTAEPFFSTSTVKSGNWMVGVGDPVAVLAAAAAVCARVLPIGSKVCGCLTTSAAVMEAATAAVRMRVVNFAADLIPALRVLMGLSVMSYPFKVLLQMQQAYGC